MKHKDVELIKEILSVEEHVLLVGPTGCGKTHLSKQIAEELGLTFYSTNAITEEYKLLGYNDISGKYLKTDFIKAIEEGGLFLMDELDASIPEALLLINTALANGYINTPNGKYDVHKNFRCIATANTINGANNTYTGRNKLDAATINRFIVVDINYDTNLELQIINNYLKHELSSKYVQQIITDLREYNEIFSTRNIVQLVKLISLNSKAYKNVLHAFEEISGINRITAMIDYINTDTFEKAKLVYGNQNAKTKYLELSENCQYNSHQQLVDQLLRESFNGLI